MADGDIEVYYEGKPWHVRRQGENEPLSDHATKEAALKMGRLRAEAEGVEFYVRNRDGTIAEKDSHGNDPPEKPG
ncbi:DUF2188 domain-containing protein [Promicromonospora sp. NPDC023987]|uniref:DUF2188 domain-containing protein n=1 Tax=Promicromonospora sp. NPDC023987 TaxID=3155360 RepID=UPI0033F1E88E